MATNDDVAKVSPEQNAMICRSEMERTLMAGTAAMRAAGEKYLPKEAAETREDYDNRKKRSTLFNAFSLTVGSMTGKVFEKPVQLKDTVPDKLKAYAENIDLTGRHINVFARDVFYDGLQTGINYILADMPPPVTREDGQPATIADEQKAGNRPYLVHITLERLLGWKSETQNGAEVLTQVRIQEFVKEPDGEFAEKTTEQIRVLEPDKWRTFRKVKNADGSEIWLPYGGGPNKLGKITLTAFYTNRTGFMSAEPPLEKLAELNVAHWQSQSDQRNILHVARVPILFGAGFDNETKMTVGANSMIRTTDANAKLAFVEHTGAAIGAGDKDLENLERQMEAAGLQLLVNKAGSKQTATGETRDASKENSPLAMMATALEDTLEVAFGFMAEYEGLGADAGGEIGVNKDFGIAADNRDLQQLAAVRAQGDLSQETLWEEMQRRNFLSDSFDAEKEKERLASEPPPLGALPGPGMNLDGNAPQPGTPPHRTGMPPQHAESMFEVT